jgi:hypothetical protein
MSDILALKNLNIPLRVGSVVNLEIDRAQSQIRSGMGVQTMLQLFEITERRIGTDVVRPFSQSCLVWCMCSGERGRDTQAIADQECLL